MVDGGKPPDPGDLIEAVYSRDYGRVLAEPGTPAGGAFSVALGGDRGDQLLDPGAELADLGGGASIWSSSIRWSLKVSVSASGRAACLV